MTLHAINLGGVDALDGRRSGGVVLHDYRVLPRQLSNNECQVPGGHVLLEYHQQRKVLAGRDPVWAGATLGGEHRPEMLRHHRVDNMGRSSGSGDI